MKTHASLEFFESSDPLLFRQYVNLRKRVFRDHYELSSNFGEPDETDGVSHIGYAVQGDVVAGGARLTIATPDVPRVLPLEESSLKLRDCPLWSRLDLARRPYAEISRMAVDPASTDGYRVSCGIGRLLCAVAARHGVDLIFSICPPAAARLNRLNARHCGVQFNIYSEIDTVFGIPMSLCAFSGILSAFSADPPRNERDVLPCNC